MPAGLRLSHPIPDCSPLPPKEEPGYTCQFDRIPNIRRTALMEEEPGCKETIALKAFLRPLRATEEKNNGIDNGKIFHKETNKLFNC